MPSEVPHLFDEVKLEMLKKRLGRGIPERFLLDRVALDLEDRLATLLRHFPQGLDFGTPFGAFARSLETAGCTGAVRWVDPLNAAQDAPDIDPAEWFDIIVSGMLFQRINDLPGLMVRLKARLNPDGLLLAAFPGGDTLHELRDVLISAESEIRGSAGLRIYPMVDVRNAGSLLQRAGLALPVADTEKIVVRYPDLLALMLDLRAMGASASLLNRRGTPGLTRTILRRAAELYQDRYADADGKIRASFEIIWMSGWAAHDSQQKPLKPGSAKQRLADALSKVSMETDRKDER